jgi:uncharacterized delta-60 repeat protein
MSKFLFNPLSGNFDLVYNKAEEIEFVPDTPELWTGTIANTGEALNTIKSDIADGQFLVKEPTGFVDRTSTTLEFDDVSREFLISPVGASFDVYIKGNKYTKIEESIIISDDPGNHYIYYDDSGALSETAIFDPSLFENNAFVSIIYWNTNTSTHSYFADERHGLVMDGATHGYLHTVFGARYISGLALQNFEPDGTGDSGIEAQFEGDLGSIRDEDILISLDASSFMPVLFREGSQWRKKTADAFPVIYNGTAGYTGTRLAFNEFTGGAWQLTEVTDGDFVLCHVFATNDYENPYVALLGVNQYPNIPAARAAAETEISSLSGLPFAEFVAVGTVIFQTSSAYTNDPKARVRSAAAGEIYVDFRGEQLYTPSGVATSHSLLSNLSSDDHPQYVKKAGDTMTGTLGGVAPTLPEHLTTKQYVDDAISGGGTPPYVLKTGDVMSGTLAVEDVDNFTSYSTTQVQLASNLNDHNVTINKEQSQLSGTYGDFYKAVTLYQNGLSVAKDDNVLGTLYRTEVVPGKIVVISDDFPSSVPMPTVPGELTTKAYVDAAIVTATGNLVTSIADSKTNELLATLDLEKSYDISYEINRSVPQTNATSFNYAVTGQLPSYEAFRNISNDTITFILRQPDGKYIIGGSFTTYKTQLAKNYLIRLNADGSEDLQFTANAVLVDGYYSKVSSALLCGALQPDGKILIGGFFSNYGLTTSRSYVVRLNADGTEDLAFNANTTVNINNIVRGLAVGPDGKIVLVGQFTNAFGATGKSFVIRLNADGTEDTAFSTNAVVNGVTPRFVVASPMRHVSIQADNKVLVAGGFTSWTGTTSKKYLLRFNVDGTEDTAFTNNATVTGGVTAKLNASVFKTSVLSDGRILFCGDFANYNGTGKSSIACINADGTEDTVFSANNIVNGTTWRYNNIVNCFFEQADGKILIGGSFTIFDGDSARSSVIRVSSTGVLDTSFNPLFSLVRNPIGAIHQSEFGIHLGQGIQSGSAPYFRYLVVNDSGVKFALSDQFFTGDITSTTKLKGTVIAAAEQSDGKVILGGSFLGYGGSGNRNYLIRVNADGSEDTAFTANAVLNGTAARFNGAVHGIVVQTDGKILICGAFSNYNTTGKNYLIRLNSNGTEDTTFSTNAVINVSTARFSAVVGNSTFGNGITLQADGKIIVYGQFSNYNATGKNYLIRLNSDGTEDTAFSTAAVVNVSTGKFNNNVYAVIVQPDGKIIVGGLFSLYNAVAGKNYLIRLNADGTEDTLFSTNNVVNGTTARFAGPVYTLALQSNGFFLVGGGFIGYNGVAGKNYLLRFATTAVASEDTTFATNAVVNGTTARFTSNVSCVKQQPDGKLIITGTFAGYGSIGYYIIRLNLDGTQDVAFTGGGNSVSAGNVNYQGVIVGAASPLISVGATAVYILSSSYVQYRNPSSTSSFFFRLDANPRITKGTVQCSPDFSRMIYSTPSTLSSYATGVTLWFGSDGIIRYTSTVLSNSTNSVNTITLSIKEV